MWGRIDDSCQADAEALDAPDARRVMFLRTRADAAITVDHLAMLDGLLYDVRSIQELSQREELPYRSGKNCERINEPRR